MSPDLELAHTSLQLAMSQLAAAEADGYGSRDLSLAKTKTEDALVWLEHMMRKLNKS